MDTKIHYLEDSSQLSKNKDIVFNYLTENNKRVYAECDTIMDFIDTMESNSIDIPMLDYTDVNVILFNNKLNTKKFSTIAELLNHCKQIVK